MREKLWWFNEESEQVLNRGYLLKGETLEGAIERISTAAAKRLYRPELAEAFKEIIERGWVSLSSPIWANMGTKRGLPISCFNTHIPDSVEGITGKLGEVIVQTKQGGGTSGYFGELRGRGSAITDNGKSSGAVSFMKLFDTTMDVVSQGACYQEGTKVLTQRGYVDFREVKETDLLAQVDEYNNVSFTKDYELVVNPFKGELVKIKGIKRDSLVNIGVTPNHRMVIERTGGGKNNKHWKGYTEIVKAEDLRLHRDNRMFFSGCTEVVGRGLNDEERFMIVYQADGRKCHATKNTRFRFSKERKINRFKELIESLNLDFTLNYYGDVAEFNVKDVEHLKKDTLSWVTLEDKSLQWCLEFLEEVSNWDGSKNKNKTSFSYSSVDKDCIDIIQAISSICGKRSRITKELRGGNRSDLYIISISDKAQIQGDSCEIYREHYDGKVYCAVVPKGRLIVNYEGRTLVCGNTRRGAFAAYLDIDHPDIEEFLTIKDIGSPIQNLFTGVCVPDYWMQEMIDGDSDKRKIWARVLESRQQKGLPYIFFSDNVNRNKPQVYIDKGMVINASNLCMVGSDRVLSQYGYLTAKKLNEIGTNLTLFNGYEPVPASSMKLREKNAKVYKVTLSNGMEHTVTKYHGMAVLKGKEVVRTELSDLKIGDKIAIQVNKGIFGTNSNEDLAYLLGLYQSDGTQYKNIKFIDIWENDFDLLDDIQERFNRVHKSLGGTEYKVRNQFGETKGVRKIESPKFLDQVTDGVKKKRLGSVIFNKVDFNKGYVPDWIWTSDEATQWMYVKGLLEADGTTFMSESKGNPLQVSYADTNEDFLKELQLLFNNLGLNSSIRVLREEGETLLPDGKGGHKFYNTKTCYRLIVGNKNDALVIEKNTGFLSRKGIFMEDRKYRDNTKKSAKVISIEYVGKEDVYCPTIYNEEHVFIANGVKTFNCSEIALPSTIDESFVCCLASMNLELYDEWKDTNTVQLAIYLLDAVLSEFIEKTENNYYMQSAYNFAKRHRALGLGVLGWHSFLQSKMIPFESVLARAYNTQIFKLIQEKAYEASEELGTIFGEPEILKGYGRRNTTLMAIAPTTSSSSILGQVSPGIEPYASNYYKAGLAKGNFMRKNKYLTQLLQEKGLDTEAVWRQIMLDHGSVMNVEGLSVDEKAVFKTFKELSQAEIIAQAADRQVFIDQAQSLNVNIPSDLPVKDVNRLYIDAWKKGVKTLYYQRSNSVSKDLISNLITCGSCEA